MPQSPPTSCMPSSNADHRALLNKAFHSRRSHFKSRTGCDACKRRKKKCDESRPKCSGCLKLRINCHYVEARGSSEASRSLSPYSPSTIVTCHGLPGLKPHEVELLRHFHLHTIDTLGSCSVQEAITGCLAAAIDLDFLRHAILTLATSHLVYLSECQAAATIHHFDQALSTFRRRLSSPVKAAQVDAVITTCVLLNTIAFSKDPQTPQGSWLVTGTADLQWLTLHIGLRRIMFDVGHLLKESSWKMVYAKDVAQFWGRTSALFDNDSPESEDIPEDLKSFFRTGQKSNTCDTVYQSILQSLVPLLTLEPSSISLTQLMAIVHRLDLRFYQLIQFKDLRALLLLAHWLGLLCEVYVWWVSTRARSECFACCEYLDARGDETIRRLLSFPAQRCGYHMTNDLGQSGWSLRPAG